MRTVRFDGGTVEMAGGALTPLAWHRAFPDDDLWEEVAKVERLALSGKADMLSTLKVAYAMAWTADYAKGAQTDAFEAWLSSLGGFDAAELVEAVVSEARTGFFRRSAGRKGREGAKRGRAVGEGRGGRAQDGPGAA